MKKNINFYQILFLCVAGAMGIAAGYIVRPYIVVDIEKKFNYSHSKFSDYSENKDFACSSIGDVSLSRYYHEDNTLNASINKGTDKLSLKIDKDSNTIKLLTATGVEAGATEAVPFTIIEDTESYVVAIGKIGVTGPSYSTLVFDKDKLEVMWTKNADTIVKYGSVMYLTCN